MICIAPTEATGTSVRLNNSSSTWNEFLPEEPIITLYNGELPVWKLICQQPCNVRFMVEDEIVVSDNIALCELKGSINGVGFAEFGLWMGTHAALRGIQAAEGDAGQIAARVSPIKMIVEEDTSFEELVSSIQDNLQDGDIVAVSEKIVAITQRRVASRVLLKGRDPKFLSYDERCALAKELQTTLNFPVSTYHLTLIDHLPDGMMTVGTFDANRYCSKLSEKIKHCTDKCVDVLIVDSDTGVDLCQPLTGLPTIGSTPIGATAGITYYDCLRVSAAAEYVRGHNRLTPIIIVHPSERNCSRIDIGAYRGYSGSIHVSMERVLHHGVLSPTYWVKG